MQLFVPVGTGFGKRRVKLDGSVLKFDVKNEFGLNFVTALLVKVDKLINPALKKLLESADQNVFDALVQQVDPGGQVGEVLQIKVTDHFLDRRESFLELVFDKRTVFHLLEKLVNVLSFHRYFVDGFFEGDHLWKQLFVVCLHRRLLFPVLLESSEQERLGVVTFAGDEHGKGVIDLGVGDLESSERLLERHRDGVDVLQGVRLDLRGHVHAELQVEVLDDFLELNLLFVQAKQVLVEVESELLSVATLLDSEDWSVSFFRDLQVGDMLKPVLEVLVLGFLQSGVDGVASLLQIHAFLLRFPIVTEYLTDTVLIELQLPLELVHPGDFVDDLGEVTRLVQGSLHLVFVQELGFQLIDVLVHLREQLTLVLGDGTSDFGSHEELVVDSKDFEHVVGCDGFAQLLLEQLGKLRLDLTRRQVVLLLGLVPKQLAVLRDVEHVDALREDLVSFAHVCQGLLSD